jgi:integrase
MASIRKRTNKNGATSYRVDVRLKGFPPQRATFTRLTDARKWGQQTEAAIREGRYFKTAEARKHTLGDLIDRYTQDVLPSKPKARNQQQQLEWFKSEIGAHTLADITPAMITQCRDKLLREPSHQGTEKSPATVNRYLAALSHAFTVAVNEWGWLEDSPIRKVKRLTEPRGRVRFLSEGPGGELERLLEACRESSNPYLYTAFTLALSTGTRQAETMGLTWDDVDLNRGIIILRNTKNGERRRVPLVGKAQELIKAHPQRNDTPLLFPSKVKKDKPMDLRSPWETALKRAGIENFHWHDIRHTTASYLAMNGASMAEIAEVLGHKTLQMVKRYSHLSEAHTAGVVERMNQRIFGDGV